MHKWCIPFKAGVYFQKLYGCGNLLRFILLLRFLYVSEVWTFSWNSCQWKGWSRSSRFSYLQHFIFWQESVEPERKRQRREEKSSSILCNPDKGIAGQGKKKVTFDPNLCQEDKEGTAKILQPPGNKVVTLKETADIVVKYLTPFFRDGKFASKVSVAYLILFYLNYLDFLLDKDGSSKKWFVNVNV